MTDPELSLKALGRDLSALLSCIDACAWHSANALLKLKPELATIDSKTSKELIATLKRKNDSTIVSACVRSGGQKQSEFDSFHKQFKKLASVKK